MAVVRFPNPHMSESQYPSDDGYNGSEEFEEPEFTEDDGETFIDEQVEESEYSRIRRRELLRLLVRGIAAAGAAAAMGLFIWYLSLHRVYSTSVSEVIYEVAAQEDVQYVSLGNHIVYYSKDGASCLDRTGGMIWSISYEMLDPVVSAAGDMLAIVDYGGSTIYLQDASQTLGSISTNLPVRDLCVSESGRIAAVLADSDVTWIYLYDAEGSTIAYIKTTMSQSGYPVSVALSPDGELMCVSHLLADSTGISSSVAFYNFGSVGQNFAENNVSGFNYDDEIFPYTIYLTDSSCAAVSDARIVFYTGKEIPQSSSNALFTQNLEGVYAGGEYVALLFPDSSGEEDSRLQIYDASGNLEGTILFTMEFTSIQLAGNCVYINNDVELLVYTVTGQLRYEGGLPDAVSQIVPTGSHSGRFYAVTENGIERITLQ